MIVAWAEFSWEAFATLTTGAAAVLAAYLVGLRQNKIARKQTEILDRQTKLQEANVRIELLTRREACISRLRVIQGEWWRDAKLSDERWREFVGLLHDSALLFPKDLVADIDKAVDGLFFEKHWYSRAQMYRESGNSDLSQKRLDQSFAEGDKVMEIMPKLLGRMVECSRVDI